MPSNIVMKLIERVAALEARVEALVTYQKYQIGLLIGIFSSLVVSYLVK